MDLKQRVTADDVWMYVCGLSEKVINDFEKAGKGDEFNYESRLNLQKLISFYNEMQVITDNVSDYETASNWFRLSRVARNEDTVDEHTFESNMIEMAEMFQEFKLLIPRFMLRSSTNRLAERLNKSEESTEESFFEDSNEDEVA